MSDTITVEPTVETPQLLRRASDPKPQALPPRMPLNALPAAPRNSFSFMQVALLIGIVVLINGMFLLFVTLRTSAPAASGHTTTTTAPAKKRVVRTSRTASAPAAVKIPSTKPVTVQPAASEPTAAISHTVNHQPVAEANRAVSGEPVALKAPVIDTIEYNGSIIHMAWESLGKNVTYKVYVMPNVKQPSFQFRFNKYGPSMDWLLNENTSWRYVAITAVDKNGKESLLSNIVDTTPTLPKPEF